MKAPPAIGFRYRASVALAVATVVVAVLALVAAWSSAGPGWLRLALGFAVAGVGGAALGRLWRPRVRSLLWHADGGVDLTLNDTVADGRREAVGTVQHARVMGPLIVLTLRWPPRERAHLWLLPDNLDPDTRRRLRVRLGAGPRHPVSGNADNP